MSFQKFKGCGEEARESKEMREGSEFSEESLGVSLYIFYNTCDVKKNPKYPNTHTRTRTNARMCVHTHRLSMSRSDAENGASHLAGLGLRLGILSHPFYICISCLDLDRIF